MTKKGIPDAIIKVEDHDHDIRSGERLNYVLFLRLVSQAIEIMTVFPGKGKTFLKISQAAAVLLSFSNGILGNIVQ